MREFSLGEWLLCQPKYRRSSPSDPSRLPTTIMKKLFKFPYKKSTKSQTGATTERHHQSEPNIRLSGTIDNPLSHAAHATSTLALAATGTFIPSQSNDPQHISRPPSPVLATACSPVKSTDKDQLAIPAMGASSMVEDKPGWKTTAYSTARMALEVIKDSSDACVPLKSVVGGISVLLRQYDVSIRLPAIHCWLITYGGIAIHF